MDNLPPPRRLLCSLLDSISHISIPAQEEQSERRPLKEKPLNPLQRMHPRDRPLLTTLHVLFPSLLLPALDLLDRQLVTRLVREEGIGTARTAGRHGGGAPLGETGGGTSASRAHEQVTDSKPSEFDIFLARSAAPLPSRRRQSSGAQAPRTTYIVHLAAWNCTCASFAFSAYPISTTPAEDGSNAPGRAAAEQATAPAAAAEAPGLETGSVMLTDDGSVGTSSGRNMFSFGGWSPDGRADEDGAEHLQGALPCCKHLLACALAVRWESALGSYLAVRSVSREELAGIVADV